MDVWESSALCFIGKLTKRFDCWRFELANSMRILYDGFIYSIQAAGGINRYFSQIIKRLPQNYIPTVTASHINYVDQPSHPNLALIKYRSFRPGRISCRVEKLFFRMFSARNYDVIHP